MRHCELWQGTPTEIWKCAHCRPRPWWRWLQLQPSCGSPQWRAPDGKLSWKTIVTVVSHHFQCEFDIKVSTIKISNSSGIIQWWDVVISIVGCLVTVQTNACYMLFLAATKQLYKWYFPSVRLSVCPSVRPSVCHTFFTMFPSSYHHEIFRSYYHGQKWCPCKRSRSEVKGQGHRGQHPT